MPIIESAKKQMRVSRKNQARNYRMRRTLKEAVKEVILVAKEGKKENATKSLQKAYKVIDTSAKKHLIHPNNAARQKSKLAKLVDNMGKAAATVAPAKKVAPKEKTKKENVEVAEATVAAPAAE